MKFITPKLASKRLPVVVGIALLVLIGITWNLWWPPLTRWVQASIQSRRPKTTEHAHGASGHAAEHEEEGHDHEGHTHAGHDEGSSLELSAQAMRNLGLSPEYIQPVSLETYRRTIVVPAVVVGRPGRTQLHVSTPLTGSVQHVHAVTGETVRPGDLLFEIRITHEDMVTAQQEFLKTMGELEVERREIDRLTPLAESGAAAGRLLLERQYARDRLEVLLEAQREALKMHGLSERQVNEIATDHRLLKDLQIMAPSTDVHGEEEELHLTSEQEQLISVIAPPEIDSATTLLTVEQLNVRKGQSVVAGALLCTLADYRRLYVEGHAFEQDSAAINQAIQNNWTTTAQFNNGAQQQEVDGLTFSYVANTVDPVTRTLSFFVNLPNQPIRDITNEDGQRFLTWEYRPGQRLQLLVPVEEWQDQIVLPVDAVAREGAESYVFQQNGKHFDRVPVHVRYRDQNSAVVANDGSISPGDVIAMRSAHQMQIALKNKAGGAVDPHAGHHH